MFTRKLLALFAAGWLASAAFAQAPLSSFAGKWSGSWTNSQGAGGSSSLELTEDANGNFTGVWDGIALSGVRVNANTLELRGRTNDVASYQITAAIANGEMSLRYLAASLGKNIGSYDGRATLLRAGSPAAAQRRAFMSAEIAKLEEAIAADEQFIAANRVAQAGVRGVGDGLANQGERQNDLKGIVAGLLAKGLSQGLASRMAERVLEAQARIDANRRLLASVRAELNANPPGAAPAQPQQIRID